MASRLRHTFHKNIARGRAFERTETAGWKHLKDGVASFEVSTKRHGKAGRIDIRIDELGDFISIIELKATDWDKILPHRIRQTALRHARQIWRYIEKEVDEEGRDVCPGIIYPEEPANLETKAKVEQLLNDEGLQVVWRNSPNIDTDRSV